MIRERLKSMDLRITELANYLHISRPTMYKFLDYYDNEKFDLINKDVLMLFNYIQEHELAGKPNVINFILNNFTNITNLCQNEDISFYNKLKQYLIENPDSKKSKFLEIITTKNTYDKLIFYLVDIEKIIKKRKLTEEEKNIIQPYVDIMKRI